MYFLYSDVLVYRWVWSNCLFVSFIQYSVTVEEAEKNRKLSDILGALDFNQLLVTVKSLSRAEELISLMGKWKFPATCVTLICHKKRGFIFSDICPCFYILIKFILVKKTYLPRMACYISLNEGDKRILVETHYRKRRCWVQASQHHHPLRYTRNRGSISSPRVCKQGCLNHLVMKIFLDRLKRITRLLSTTFQSKLIPPLAPHTVRENHWLF